MTLKFRIAISILTVAVAILAGCSKEPEKAAVTVTGPAGMTLIVDDQKAINTPVTFMLPGGTYLFKYHAPNHERKWETVVLKNAEKRNIKVNLTPETAAVLINTKPVGAQLVVDGRVLGTTPLVIEKVASGKEFVGQLRMRGYAEREVKWSADGARPKQVMIDLDANMVKVEFLSKPPRAQLTIDDRVVGETPYRGELTEGKYKLRFELAGFLPLEQTVSLSRGENFKAEYVLASLPGGISISSVPDGAAIFINNQKRGITPCVLTDIPAGIYEIRAEKEGFDPVKRKVEIAAGYKDEIKLVLLSSTGELELAVRPVGVKVEIDGKLIGVTQASQDTKAMTEVLRVGNLSPGKHLVTVSHPHARPESRTISVVIEKGKLTRPKAIDVWIANYEIKYRDGRVEIGKLFQESEQSILFEPERGVRYEVPRSYLEYIKKLP
ncbi:MAG: PEGA domain-containing protein [Victivallales bacterium]|jgi:hypothetical protein|nr:PEGA domain-containing protein [Victivallales bacterium]